MSYSGKKCWPHAPPHWTFLGGTCFVTASTYHREPRFDRSEKLTAVTNLLIETARGYGWQLRAWVMLSNHYHLLAQSPEGTGDSLRKWLQEFHRQAAIKVNELDETPGRRVWMNFRESLIDRQTSYLARLRYVNENAAKHGVVPRGNVYRWCSAAWFETHAPASMVESVSRFQTDKLKIEDDFEVLPVIE